MTTGLPPAPVVLPPVALNLLSCKIPCEHPFRRRIIGVRGKNCKTTNLQFQNDFEK